MWIISYILHRKVFCWTESFVCGSKSVAMTVRSRDVTKNENGVAPGGYCENHKKRVHRMTCSNEVQPMGHVMSTFPAWEKKSWQLTRHATWRIFRGHLYDGRDIWYDSKLHTGNFIDGTWKEIWYYNYMTYTLHSKGHGGRVPELTCIT